MFDPATYFIVIDDFRTMRVIVKKTLNQLGYSNIIEAEDGAQAFVIMQKAHADGSPIQCVVSDWNMPNMSGLELLKKCRLDPNYKGVPFMLVTAENEQKQVIEAAKAGVSNYIVKPFSVTDFQTKLTQVYARHFKKAAA
ncbi:MAG: response regulator [Pseudobdellovibrionaceae bacterium]